MLSFDIKGLLFLHMNSYMQNQALEEFSQRVAQDFARACDSSSPGKDRFSSAYDYGNDNKTQLINSIIKLGRDCDTPKEKIIHEIKEIASHMNALSYVYLVAADLAHGALEN